MYKIYNKLPLFETANLLCNMISDYSNSFQKRNARFR